MQRWRTGCQGRSKFGPLRRSKSRPVGEGVAVFVDQRAAGDIGGLIASATTLALAVELYIKGLRVLTRMPVARTHQLWSLYKQLPRDLKLAIEADYQSQTPPRKDATVTLEVALHSVGPAPKEELAQLDDGKNTVERPDNSLPAVLRRCSDAFQTWRYLHEGGPPGSITIYRYEFHYLDVAADSLRCHLVTGLDVRGYTAHSPGGGV